MQRKPLATVGNTEGASRLPQPNSLKRNHTEARIPQPQNKIMKPPEPKKAKNATSSIQKPAAVSNLSRSSSMISVATTGRASTLMRSAPVTGRASTIMGRAPLTGRTSTAMSHAPSTTTATKKAPKRAAWDVKGRLADMEVIVKETSKMNSQFEVLINESNQRISMLEKEKSEVQANLAIQSSEKSEVSAEVDKLSSQLKAKCAEIDDMKRNYEKQIDDLKYTKETLERRLSNLQSELETSEKECQSLKATIATISSAQAGIKAELSAVQIQLTNSQDECATKANKINELQRIIREKDDVIEKAEQRLREEEGIRRKLHNAVQELKGNIRVFCRVRPLLANEISSDCNNSLAHVSFPDSDKRSVTLNKTSEVNLNESCANGRAKSASKYDFSFDRVFEPSSSQQEVFEEISQLVQSVLDGYNVCVFAYGQTGSGKTYTMEGPDDINDDSQVGMIPKAVEQIFSTGEGLKSKGWSYTVEASYLEIYNETIRDLLGSNDDSSKHDIKMKNSKGSEIYVSNLTTETVDNAYQVNKLIKKARKNRAVAATKCNHRSSRSHSVFQLKLTGSNSLTSEACEGILNLVDLAGSERLKDSGSEGDRLTETKKINSSLSVLGNVIMALANKAEHVPYRNSKLTHLLMNSLGGNSKTLMFVNISPREEHFNETLNSLRFATKVNQCNIGTAQKKMK